MNARLPPFATMSAASAPARPLSLQWAAVAEGARIVAAMAQSAGDGDPAGVRAMPALLANADPLRREQVRACVADLAAVLEYGLAALVAVNARGADPRPAATALWREYHVACQAILALLPPATIATARRLG